jgi:hypothetical protein
VEYAQPDVPSDELEARVRRMMQDEAKKREEMEKRSTASMEMLTAQLNTMMGLLGDVRRQDRRPDWDETVSREPRSDRQPDKSEEVKRVPRSDDDLRSVGSMYEERPTVLSAGAAGAFMDESLQARLETRTARDEVRNASNEALSLLLTTSKRKAQANLFANFTTGQQEHLYLLQKLGVPMADLKPRLHISMVAALRGWNRQLQYVGVALGLTEPAYKFARTNHSVYGSATRDAEYKSVTKHVVGHEFESQTLMGLEVPGTVKRTLPENPAGGWNKIGSIGEWDGAMLHMYMAVKECCGREWSERILEYIQSMADLWATTNIFKNQFSVFVQFDEKIREMLMHWRRTSWVVDKHDSDLEHVLDGARAQASAIVERGRASPVQRPGTGQAGGMAGKPSAGGKAGSHGSGYVAPTPKALEVPKSIKDCLAKNYEAIKNKSKGGRGYCLQYLLGKCANPPNDEGDGCKAPGGANRLHMCVRCEGNHPITAPGVCPQPRR